MSDEGREAPRDPSVLAGRVALVTGAGSPIGREIVAALADEGVSLIVADSDLAEGERLAEAIRGRRADAAILAVEVEVRSETSVAALIETALERYGSIDMLVHCAGLSGARGSSLKPVAEVPILEIHEILDVALKGTFLCNRAVLPTLVKRGSGQIINLSSSLARRGRALDALACAAHSGIVGLSEALAEEVGPFGIRVQVLLAEALAPSSRESGDTSGDTMVSLPPERVAAAVLYLLALPADMILESVVVSPFKVRKRRAKASKS